MLTVHPIVGIYGFVYMLVMDAFYFLVHIDRRGQADQENVQVKAVEMEDRGQVLQADRTPLFPRRLRQPIRLPRRAGFGLGKGPRLLLGKRHRLPPARTEGARRQRLRLVVRKIEAAELIREVLPSQLPTPDLAADQHVDPLQLGL